MRIKTIAVAALAASAALPATTSAAPEGAKLKLTKISKPASSVAAGGDLTVRATVANTGTKAGGGTLRMFLAGGPEPYDVPRRIGRFKTGKVAPQGFKRFTVRLTVPANTAPARYLLRTCLKVEGAEKCKSSPTFAVTAATT